MDSDRPLLAGGSVQRVDLGVEAVTLRIRVPGRTVAVVVAGGAKARGVGLAAGKRGPVLAAAPAAEVARWRRRLAGARVAWLEEQRVVVDLPEGRLAVVGSGGAPALIALDGPAGAPPAGALRDTDEVRLCERGEALATALAADAFATRRDELVKALRRAHARIERRAEAVRGDLARIEEASGVAARAAIFVPLAARAPRGARELVATDWSTGEAVEAKLPLDPARSAQEQLEALFRRARRLRAGAAVATRRLDEAAVARRRLDAVAERLAGATSGAAVDALVVEARAAAPRDFSLGPSQGAGAGRAGGRGPSLPYRTFAARSGARILVGKGAAHNDALTFRVARPHDLWLHAKNQKGAHVVVQRARDEDTPADLLVEAAHLAAHFSDARGEAVVEVQYTPRRYLRKPRGSAPGFVVVEREKVLALRTEPGTLERLLGAEL